MTNGSRRRRHLALALLPAALLTIRSTLAGPGELVLERTPYGLLFTRITVAEAPLVALVDFGDPYTLQLATSFLEASGLDAAPRGRRFVTMAGEELELLEGTAQDVRIGGTHLGRVTFGSAPGEIDAVAEQVGTPFQAAVGWGFFGQRRFVLDLAASRITLGIDACPDASLATVPIASGGAYLIVAGAIGALPVRFLVDTGSPLNVLHREAFEAVRVPSAPVTIDHPAGRVAGRRLEVMLGDWQPEIAFEVSDLTALLPLDVQGVLGEPFLESVRLCHDPETRQVRLATRDR